MATTGGDPMLRPLVLATTCLALPAFAQDADRGAEAFADHCAVCHGTEAIGDGPMAPVLMFAPSDLTRLSARNDGVFPAARVAAASTGARRSWPMAGRCPFSARSSRDPLV